jgi:hypothetical protein
MLASSTPFQFQIHDENASVISRKPGNLNSVSKKVVFDENVMSTLSTPTAKKQGGATAAKSTVRRALGDLSSSQMNQRATTTIAITPGAHKLGPNVIKSGLKPKLPPQQILNLNPTNNANSDVKLTLKPNKSATKTPGPAQTPSQPVAAPLQAPAQAATAKVTAIDKDPSDDYDIVSS